MIPGFTPYPGFDPLDGDSRVSLSADNPCRPASVVSSDDPRAWTDAFMSGPAARAVFVDMDSWLAFTADVRAWFTAALTGDRDALNQLHRNHPHSDRIGDGGNINIGHGEGE